MMGPSDPTAGHDASTVLTMITSGHPAVVLRDDAWQPNGERESAFPATKVVGWALVHNRSMGRLDAMFAVDRSRSDYLELVARLLEWQEEAVRRVLRTRGLENTTLVNRTGTRDTITHEALRAAGYECARAWQHMHRPLTTEDALAPEPTQCTVRRILSTADRRTAHRILEESFKDHFNSHEETFEEFEARIGTYPGHEWNLDFLAEIPGASGAPHPVGTIITSWQPGTNVAHAEYLGVTKGARGHGVGKELFRAFFKEALDLGYPRAELFVDADSPTHAQDFYERFGFTEHFRDYTWHKQVSANQ